MFEIELIICLKIDLALNNIQRFICHKAQTTNEPTNPLTKQDSTTFCTITEIPKESWKIAELYEKKKKQLWLIDFFGI